MADLRVFKSKISKACVLIRSHEAEMEELLLPFEFPNEKSLCEEFIRAKTADLNYLSRGITRGMQILEKYIKEAMERIDRRAEPKEQEKLMQDLNKHLEDDSNDLEILTIQWLNKIEFRLEELTQQAALIAAPRNSNNGTSDQDSHFQTRVDRCQRIRRPLLEVPTFSGDFREFAAFWSVFKSLVHDDAELSDQEKFLFLKQALKGKAATSVSCIPVIGDKYEAAVNILKKQYDRSSSMADILISEIERIPRANDNPKSCRETLSAISSRIIHLEQTGVSLNADRVWRRLILSKFTEHFCSTVIRKESDAKLSFNVKDIMDIVDEIVTLQETTELTTRTLFGTENPGSSELTSPISKPQRAENVANRRTTLICLCGGSHPPQYCDEFPTPELRRMEARRQEVCWRCFCRSHKSTSCTTFGKCPKCNEDHHSSLCIETSGTKGAIQAGRRLSRPQSSTFQRPSTSSRQHTDRFEMQQGRRSNQSCDIQTLSTSASQSPPLGQCVLQMASALIFNEAESKYESVTMLLDSGAQRSFIKTRCARILALQSRSSTSFTTTGMGGLQESFSSDEVHVTLKSIHGSAKLHRLPVFTKDKLIVTTKSAELSREDKSFMKKEKITVAQQGLYSRELSPDILIGQDLLNRIIDHGAPTSRLPSGLLLTPTIFGHTISGTSGTSPSSKRNPSLCSSLIITSLSSSAENNSKKDMRRPPTAQTERIKREQDTAENPTFKSLDGCRKSGIVRHAKDDDGSGATFYFSQIPAWTTSKSAQLTEDGGNDALISQAHCKSSPQKAVDQAPSDSEKVTEKFWPFRRKEYRMKLRNCHKRANKISRTSSESLNSNAVLPTTSKTEAKTEAKPRARGTLQPKDPATQISSFTYNKDVQILPIQRHRGGRISL